VTIKALIWDLEGVLMLTDDANMPLTVAKKLNVPYEKVREIFFSDTNDKVDLGEVTQDQFNEYVLETLQISRDKKHLLEEVINEEFYIDNDLLIKITGMRREYKTGLISNFSNDLRPKIENEWAISSAFDEIIISCEVGVIKPDPTIFNLMLDRLGVKADESVFIDDRIKNIDGAKKMGFHTIFFTDKEQALKELTRILQA
jgi:epoxide hydrolase-like predicted phosphatase